MSQNMYVVSTAGEMRLVSGAVGKAFVRSRERQGSGGGVVVVRVQAGVMRDGKVTVTAGNGVRIVFAEVKS